MAQEPKQDIYDTSVKLCEAVQKHKCLYDRQNENYSRKDVCEVAWNDVASICGEKAIVVKNRWRNIRTSFMRSLQKSLRKGQNASAEYYLHGVLGFLIPNIIGHSDGVKMPNELDVEDTVKENDKKILRYSSTTKNQKGLEKPSKSTEHFESMESESADHIGEKEIKKQHANTLVKKTSESSSRKLNKSSTDVIKSSTTESGITEKKQLHRTLSPKSSEGNGNKSNDSVEESQQTTGQNKRVSLLKQSLDTFYIKQRPAEVGTFIISKVSGSSENQKTQNDMGKMEIEQDLNAETDVSVAEIDKYGKSVRPRRSCKRPMDEATTKELRLRRKEPETKRQRTNKSELGEKQVVKVIEPTTPTTRTTARENKLLKQVESVELNVRQISKEKQLLQEESEVEQEELLSDGLESSPGHELSSIDPLEGAVLEMSDFESTKTVDEQNEIHNSERVADQATQCMLLAKSSSADDQNDDDFLSSLKPHMMEMNARQKLHFRKKIYQSLMEVFDDNTNFPNADDVMLNPNPPELFPSQTSDELRLIRELVSVVQAAKGIPEFLQKPKDDENKDAKLLLTNNNNNSSTNISSTNVSPSSENMTVQTEKSNAVVPVSNTSQVTSDGTASYPRRIIRRVFKLGNDANSAFTVPDAANRRVYRIYPKAVSTTAAGVDKNTSSGNMRPIVVPRGNIIANNNLQSIPLPGGTQVARDRQFTMPTNSIPATVSGAANANLNVSNVQQLLNPMDKRRILRRFSVCNPGALTVRSTPTKIPSANIPAYYANKTTEHATNILQQQQLSSGKKITTFKVPLGATNRTMAPTKPTASSTSTTSKGGVALGNGNVLNMPMPMPCLIKFAATTAAPAMPAITLTTTSAKALSSSTLTTTAVSSSPIGSPSPIAIQTAAQVPFEDIVASTTNVAETSETSECVQTAGVIGSDNFSCNLTAFPIKRELSDDEFD